MEKGPIGLFGDKGDGKGLTTTASSDAATIPGQQQQQQQQQPAGVSKLSVNDLLEGGKSSSFAVDETELETTSLFVRNLAFSTTTAGLEQAFGSLDGFVSARVKTKADPKRPGQVLSMGFGFVEFRTREDATAALGTMDNHVLDGHALGVKASHKAHDAAEERRREDKAKKAAGKRTKIIVKNLPFEATKKEVRALFGAYGTLRAVRVPRKLDKARGFAFAEYTTAREAENAMAALGNTHLLGRRLVLDYAEAEAENPEEEIEKMQRNVGGQVDRVALQKLTGRGRTRVEIDNGEERPE